MGCSKTTKGQHKGDLCGDGIVILIAVVVKLIYRCQDGTSSLVAQQVKDPKLPLLWPRLLLWHRLEPWPGNFRMLQHSQKRKKKVTQTNYTDNTVCNVLVLIVYNSYVRCNLWRKLVKGKDLPVPVLQFLQIYNYLKIKS